MWTLYVFSSSVENTEIIKKKSWSVTSKFIVILTEFPALTTMKLFILRVVNFGLTKTLKKINERCNRVILKREKEMISGQVLMFEIFDKKKIHTE